MLHEKSPPHDVILVANGPGEVAGWAVPLARALRSLGSSEKVPLRLSLILPPCQFSTGRERDVAASLNLFDRIEGPWDCLKVIAGLKRFPVGHRACLVHLGGDLWYSQMLSRRLNVPAFAYVETPLVARRHRPFRRLFVPTAPLAKELGERGVPEAKIRVVGDLRADALSGSLARSESRSRGSVVMLTGSRAQSFLWLLPFFLEVAKTIKQARPEVSLSLPISPFLPPCLVEEALRKEEKTLKDTGIIVVEGGRWDLLASAELALTIPGTNTLELSMLGIPMIVVLPLQEPGRIPLEGLLEWVGRVPGIGPWIKWVAIRRYIRRKRFVALPNLLAGRKIVPEMIGPLSPGEVAAEALRWLEDDEGRRNMTEALRNLHPEGGGAAMRIAQEVLGRDG
ncbi:MAG: hypothetical protein QN121_11180 [Armatimonadota bacterium]|nr:hypothetical protein [Armatimonadota bacterium]